MDNISEMRTFLVFILAVVGALVAPSEAAPIKVVAAENFYGGVANLIAGNAAGVTSILTNPNQDPHEFASSAGTARAIADADIFIYSGIDYDPWAEKLLSSRGNVSRIVINVSNLIGAKEGDNPHIWYNLKTMPALADKLALVLAQLDPARASVFVQNATAFKASMKPMLEEIEEIKRMAQEPAVTATEPVFGYMSDALGFKMLNYDFQVKIMNDSEPSAAQTAEFETSLRSHKATILFYNSQVTDPTTARIQKIAKESLIPVVGVTETQPPDEKSYVNWMRHQLDGVKAALHEKKS